ncbi:Lrp/AsnC family transcriptional regulator [Aliiglaciecola sp. CAU 1673]|uniref:Lrp/AsnC family transcriptional regulator n=1 Tax=Aliiglaciecola sp. CAU 1673 TaxID=3032595 RepID=UPI0023DCCF9E|nr:Lrp/AsnC family transcriptional regulator [Aliiglaciecola sp. CAU 1673]MDF2178522.1 Lrp/AsnC family transcriptional regulator [Aliiglaciecola sp. CAU 1673]
MKRTLDSTDLAILELLYTDARITNKELAAKVGLAPSSCLERVKRLQQEAVIQGTRLQLDMRALGGHLQALISVRLSNHNRETVDNFAAALQPLPEVINLLHMGGENDFLVHVTLTDTAHLRDFVFNAITARPEVHHVETALVYNAWPGTKLPSFVGD